MYTVQQPVKAPVRGVMTYPLMWWVKHRFSALISTTTLKRQQFPWFHTCAGFT